MQATDALEKQVDRREIGHHDVEVHVKGLLGHLRRHDHASAPPARVRIRTEYLPQVLVVACPVVGDKARVSQFHGVTPPLLKRPVALDGPRYRIADHQCAPAIVDDLVDRRRRGLLVIGEPLKADRSADRWLRTDLHHLPSREGRDQGVLTGGGYLWEWVRLRDRLGPPRTSILTRGLRRSSAAFVCIHESLALQRRKSGRHRDNWDAISTQPLQCSLQVHPHPRIGSVDLVQHHHLPCESEVTQHHVPGCQGGHELVIDGADHRVSETRLLAPRCPVVGNRGDIHHLAAAPHSRRLLVPADVKW